jgi:hypothetical protein
MPMAIGDGGFCAPIDGGCACAADFDCCNGGCCDLSGWPGVCVSGSVVGPGFHPGPQFTGGGPGICTPSLCSPAGGGCASSLCCGQNATPPEIGLTCPSAVCCMPYDGGCVTNVDCCSQTCDSNTFTCR